MRVETERMYLYPLFWTDYVKNIISVSSYADGRCPCWKVFGIASEKY